MGRTERTYVEERDESPQWRDRLVALLGSGIYAHLKQQGLLKVDRTRSDEVRLALEQTGRIEETGEE